MRVWIFECREPSYEAYKLGFAACVLLAIAHVIANVLGGCVCISSREQYVRSSPNKQIAAASLVFSWYVNSSLTTSFNIFLFCCKCLLLLLLVTV